MGALQYVHVPGFSAAIFRRTQVEANMADSPGTRLHEWLQPALIAKAVEWDASSSSYVFPGEPLADGTPTQGGKIHLGYLKTEADQFRYQGAAFQYIAVDELTGWPESNYEFLFSRLRYAAPVLEYMKRTKTTVPLKMRATSNPGGPGHDWVKARFIENAKHRITNTDARTDMKRRREKSFALPQPPIYASPASAQAEEIAKHTGRPAQGAYFVPAFIEDNPSMPVGSEAFARYMANLGRLSPTKFARLRWGDWDAVGEGSFFNDSSFEIVDRLPPGYIVWNRAWDFAATVPKPGTDPDWTVGVKVGIWHQPTGVDDKGKQLTRPRVIVGDVVRFRLGPAKTDDKVLSTAKLDGRTVRISVEQEPGSAGKRSTAQMKTSLLFGYIVIGIRKTGPKSEYWEALSSVVTDDSPMILLRENDGDHLWIRSFIRELIAIPDGHDDQADAVAQGFAVLTEKLEGMQRFMAQVD